MLMLGNIDPVKYFLFFKIVESLLSLLFGANGSLSGTINFNVEACDRTLSILFFGWVVIFCVDRAKIYHLFDLTKSEFFLDLADDSVFSSLSCINTSSHKSLPISAKLFNNNIFVSRYIIDNCIGCISMDDLIFTNAWIPMVVKDFIISLAIAKNLLFRWTRQWRRPYIFDFFCVIFIPIIFIVSKIIAIFFPVRSKPSPNLSQRRGAIVFVDEIWFGFEVSINLSYIFSLEERHIMRLSHIDRSISMPCDISSVIVLFDELLPLIDELSHTFVEIGTCPS
jgi:hypothetical protein